jgi:hypothetical protein
LETPLPARAAGLLPFVQGSVRHRSVEASAPPNAALPLSRAATPEKMHDQSDQRNDQQQMNQPAGNMKREKSHQPQHEQNKKQR